MKNFPAIATVLLTFLTVQPALSADINSANYPALDDKEMGHIRYFVDVALQPVGNWDRMGFASQDQQGNEAYRYQLAYTTYTLAIAQHQKTPAYRELYAQVIDTMIQKMTRREVWGYWYDSSRIKDAHDYSLGEVTPWRDPIVKKNIMYSGHLLQMLGLYRMLYNDPKYDAPDSLTLSYALFGMPKEKREYYKYNHHSLAKVIYDQFADGGFIGVECEPAYVYAICNQIPVAGLIHYDQINGTTWGKEVVAEWLKTQVKKEYLHPEHKEFMQSYSVTKDTVKYMPEHFGLESISPAYQHIFNTAEIESLYPQHRDKHLPFYTSGAFAGLVAPDISLLFSAFAVYAAEMDDAETTKTMLDYADANYKPTWENGWFYYPRNDLIAPGQELDGPLKLEGVSEHPMQRVANIYFAQARINDGGGLHALYNEPWEDTFFAQPYISGVDYPRALVTQAIYDSEKQALIVGLKPGIEEAGTASIDVNHLDPQKHYVIKVDDRIQGELNKGVLSVPEGALRWSDPAKVLSLDVTLDGPTSIVIRVADET